MNKHRFRLIFSKSLGFLIPVAETTRAQRKPGQTSCSVSATSSTSPFFSLKRLAASLLLASAPAWASAELLVDPAAGGTHVITAPNGVPVIEIATPNNSGLSHNRFSEFDVVKPGVIFNNSRANGVSLLGGAILGNPNLQRPATAILSEVTGTKPSSLSGALEVFGGRADILISRVNLQGGKVAIKSAGSLTQTAATSSTSSRESTMTHTVGLTGSAGVAPTGAGAGISLGASGSYDETKSNSTSYTNGLISGTEVSIETAGDHNLIGANIKGNQVSAHIGGTQTITSVQDTSSMNHTRGNWSVGLGVAVSSAGGIVPVANASGSGGKDYDTSKLVGEQAGIDADSLDLKVAGNLNLTGAHIVSKPGQGKVDVGGKITANSLHDSREKDGGYGGGGGGMSKNGLPTATIEGGRVDQVHYQAANLATIDVGDPSHVTAGQGVEGKLNTDGNKQLNVTENRRVAGNDIKVEISVGDAKEIKAGVTKLFSPKAATPKPHLADAPTTRSQGSDGSKSVEGIKPTVNRYADVDVSTPKAKFDQRIIVNADSSNLAVNKAVDHLVAKHPDNSVVVKPNADGSHTLLHGDLKPGGTAKVEVVGHGDGLKLGNLDSKQISDVVQKLTSDNQTTIDKLNLVGCGTACAKDVPSLVDDVRSRLLAGGNSPEVKGYDAAIKVNEQGHKQIAQAGDADALGKGDRRPVDNNQPSPDRSEPQQLSGAERTDTLGGGSINVLSSVPVLNPPDLPQDMGLPASPFGSEFSFSLAAWLDGGAKTPSQLSDVLPEATTPYPRISGRDSPDSGWNMSRPSSTAGSVYSFRDMPTTSRVNAGLDSRSTTPSLSLAPPTPGRHSPDSDWDMSLPPSPYGSEHSFREKPDTPRLDAGLDSRSTTPSLSLAPPTPGSHSPDSDWEMSLPPSPHGSVYSFREKPDTPRINAGLDSRSTTPSLSLAPPTPGSHSPDSDWEMSLPPSPHGSVYSFREKPDTPRINAGLDSRSTTPSLSLAPPTPGRHSPDSDWDMSLPPSPYESVYSFREKPDTPRINTGLDSRSTTPGLSSHNNTASFDMPLLGFMDASSRPRKRKLPETASATKQSIETTSRIDRGNGENILTHSSFLRGTTKDTDSMPMLDQLLSGQYGRAVQEARNSAVYDGGYIGLGSGDDMQAGLERPDSYAGREANAENNSRARSEKERSVQGLSGRRMTVDDMRKWDDMSYSEQTAVGGKKGWLESMGIARNDAWYLTRTGISDAGYKYIARMGLSESTGSAGFEVGGGVDVDSPDVANALFKVPVLGRSNITNSQIIKWEGYSQEVKTRLGGVAGYAQSLGVGIESAARHLLEDGINSRAKDRLRKAEGTLITDAQVAEWEGLTREQQENIGGVYGFALSRGISPFSALGRVRHLSDRPEEMTSRKEGKERKISNDQLSEWKGFTQRERNAGGGWKGYASRQGISESLGYRFLTNSGITPLGEDRLQGGKQKITDAQLREWQELTSEQRMLVGGVPGYAAKKGISLPSAKTYLRENGLNAQGKARLSSLPPITNDQIIAWHGLTTAERSRFNGVAGYADEQGVNFNSAKSYLDTDGLSSLGKYRLAKQNETSITESEKKEWIRLGQEKRERRGDLYEPIRNLGNVSSSSRVRNRPELNEGGPLANDHMKEWLAFTPEQRKNVGVFGYARSRSVKPYLAKTYLTIDGFTDRGRSRLQKVQQAEAADTHLSQRAEATSGQEVRSAGIVDEGGQVGGAKTDLASPAVNKKSEVDPSRATWGGLTNDHIKEWMSFTPEQRKNSGVARYAISRSISSVVARTYLNVEGLTDRGRGRLLRMRKAEAANAQVSKTTGAELGREVRSDGVADGGQQVPGAEKDLASSSVNNKPEVGSGASGKHSQEIRQTLPAKGRGSERTVEINMPGDAVVRNERPVIVNYEDAGSNAGLLSFLERRHAAPNSLVEGGEKIIAFAKDKGLVNEQGKLTREGEVQWRLIDKEKTRFDALKELKDQSKNLAKLTGTKRRDFINRVAAKFGVTLLEVKPYIKDAKALDEDYEALKAKWGN